MSPSDSNLHRDVPPPPPPPPWCPQVAGDPGARFPDGTRRHRDSGDDSTSGVDGVDEDDDENTAPFKGARSSLSWRRISSAATPPQPPLSLEPSAEILPASSSAHSFGVSTEQSFSTSILNDGQTVDETLGTSVLRTTTSVHQLTVIRNSRSLTLRDSA